MSSLLLLHISLFFLFYVIVLFLSRPREFFALTTQHPTHKNWY
jgi:hypothetical protein